MANTFPIVTEVTKVQLDALVAANALEEGLQYKVTDKDWLLTAISPSTYLKQYGSNQTSIKAFHVQFPSINPGERLVFPINIGVLDNPNRCVLGFCTYQANSMELPKIVSGITGPGSPQEGNNYNVLNGDQKIFVDKYLSDNFLFRLTDKMLANMLIVSTDYTEVKRMVIPLGVESGSAEKYNTNTVLPAGSTYDEIGAGVIVGWYAYTSYNALFGKKVQIESVWLTKSGIDSILNFAVKNVDSTATNIQGITLAIYE